MRRRALQDHTRFDTRDMTGAIKPAARSIIPSQQQEGFIRQLSDLQHLLARQTMFRRDGGQHMSRHKGPDAEVLVTGCHEREVNIATFQAFGDVGTPVLDKVNLHGGMSASITRQEIRKYVFNVYRAGADPQYPSLSAL